MKILLFALLLSPLMAVSQTEFPLPVTQHISSSINDYLKEKNKNPNEMLPVAFDKIEGEVMEFATSKGYSLREDEVRDRMVAYLLMLKKLKDFKDYQGRG